MVLLDAGHSADVVESIRVMRLRLRVLLRDHHLLTGYEAGVIGVAD